jgi:molybdate transport system regulatory protein
MPACVAIDAARAWAMPPRQTRRDPALRIRLPLGNGQALGPGKADLLDAIAATGSIAAAGRAMAMSYKRAWQLVDGLNRSFSLPLVHASKGGGRGGGAELTPAGRKILSAYRAIEVKAIGAAGAEVRAILRLAR